MQRNNLQVTIIITKMYSISARKRMNKCKGLNIERMKRLSSLCKGMHQRLSHQTTMILEHNQRAKVDFNVCNKN